MKYIKPIFATVALALSLSNVNAATIQEDSLIISILNGDTGEAMLIDTQIATSEFVDGTITTWESNTDLTLAIDSFLGGTTNAEFWVAGSYAVGFDTFALSTVPVDPSSVLSFNTQVASYITDANFGVFATADEGLTENWVANIPENDPSHFDTPGLLGNGLVAPVPLGEEGDIFVAQFGFFGTDEFVLDPFVLSADGTLSYGATVIPVPAAAWLFGSGLIGLVGVARRRKA